MDISVIIAYKEDRGYLKQCMDSILNQDFGGTFELLMYKGDQIFSKNANEAIKKAKGEFIKFVSDDDELLPCCLRVLHENSKNQDLIFANAYDLVGEERIENKSLRPLSLKALVLVNTIHGATTLYRRSSLEKVKVEGNVFRENFLGRIMDTAEEYELHLRMMKAGMKFKYVDEFVALYRRHGEQKGMGKKPPEEVTERSKFVLEIKRFYD